MAIKIGKWYITRNNPREILRISANKQNIIDELEEFLNEFETKEFNYNFLVVRVKDIQDKLKELKEKYDER